MSITKPDILLNNFKIESGSEPEIKPSLKISFDLKNTSKKELYMPLLPSCKITLSGQLLIETSFLHTDDGSWTHMNNSLEEGYRSAALNSSESIRFIKYVELSYDIRESIESKFNVPNRPGSINLDIQIIIPILCYGQKDEGILAGENAKLCKYNFRHRIDSDIWLGWLRSWGFRMNLMMMPE